MPKCRALIIYFPCGEISISKKKDLNKNMNIKMNKINKVLTTENLLINKMELTNIFFYETEAKINVYLHIKEKPEPSPICFVIKDKQEVSDLVLYADDLEYTLKINEPINKLDTFTESGVLYNEKISLHDRIIMGRTGDVISFITMPLIFTNIYLDWEMQISDNNTAIVTLKNFDKH